MNNAPSSQGRLKHYEVYSVSEPNSVFNLLPDCKLKDMMEVVPDELKDIDEEELAKIVTPSLNVQMLRQTFWAEYRTAIFANRKISIENCYAGIMSRSAFARNITPHTAAYILCPTQDYFAQLELAHDMGMQNALKILSIPRTGDPKKDYNYDRLKLEIFKFLNDKKHGAAVQKQLTIQHNVKEAGSGESTSVEELKKQFKSGDIIEVDT